jgi:hypothetical protein
LKDFNGKSTQKPTALNDNIKGTVFHENYLQYLSTAYATHHGIVIKPDYIWYTILCEIAMLVKKEPAKYQQIFTDSKKKKEVSVPTLDPVVMPINTLIDALFDLIPKGLSREDILLNFSTTGKADTFGFSTAFLDAASPYYNYSMYMCGFNKIKVLGTVEDYKRMLKAINHLVLDIFDMPDEISPVMEYLMKIALIVEDLKLNFDNREFWAGIFYVEFCGSGHQEEVRGWFSNLFAKYPDVGYVQNFSTHLSVINYKNITTDKEYTMNSGILSSVVENDYLMPEFEYYINEIITNKK